VIPPQFHYALSVLDRGAVMAGLNLLESPADQILLVEGLLSDAKVREKSATSSAEIYKDTIAVQNARDQRMRMEVLLIRTKRKQHPEYGESELRKLFEELVECAKEQHKLLEQGQAMTYLGPLWLERFLACNERQLDYNLELRRSPEDQLPLIQESLNGVRELEKNLRDSVLQGIRFPEEYEKARGRRLELEVLLAKTTRKKDPQKPVPSEEELHKLLAERVSSAKAQYDRTRAREHLPNTAFWIRELLECRHHALPYALELADSPAKKEAAIRADLEEVKKLETDIAERVKVHWTHPPDLELVREWRLELEVLLVRTKGAAKSDK
jgi:hypothetical protein